MDSEQNGKEKRVVIGLKKGQYVVANSDIGLISAGEVLQFINYNGLVGAYTFCRRDGKKVFIVDDSKFSTMPDKETIRDLIDIVLSLNDKVWFEELVKMLNADTNFFKK
ncbi:hypothetical protein D3C87_76100 [compost metagenome]